MRADEAYHEESTGCTGERAAGRHAAPGRRHAAPRKALFTRLQMPAGKAFALAAMPTAVLMGMGLTPTFAAAEGLPKNTASDACVSQPEEAPDDGQKADDGKTTDGKGLLDQKSDASGKDGKSDPSASTSPSPSASATPSGSTKSAPSGGSTDTSSAPSESKSSGSLLGDLGDTLGNVLSGGQDTSASSDTGSSTPTPSASQGSKGSGSLVNDVVGSATDTAGKVGDTAKHVTDGVKDTAGKAASPSVGDLLSKGQQGEDGAPSYPCVVEKKTAGKAETPPVSIPNQPWNLQASSLLLKGLDYKGVVNLTTPDGHTKQVLKFTADDGVDIGDLHQTVAGQEGKTYHIQAASGSTSTIRGGRVTMYTESLSGNLFGLIPIVFDAEHPPPLNIPVAYFTNVKIVQAGQFGGNLTVPGLHQYLTG